MYAQWSVFEQNGQFTLKPLKNMDANCNATRLYTSRTVEVLSTVVMFA
jgi:hypothetical protein